MSRIGSRDTVPELAVRRAAHRMGFRFRLHKKELPGRPDLVFTPHRLAVFVHGCFWHRHAGCANSTMPKTRPEFWQQKSGATSSTTAAPASNSNGSAGARLSSGNARRKTPRVWNQFSPLRLSTLTAGAKAGRLMKPSRPDPFEVKRLRLLSGGKPRVLDICGGAGGFSLGFMKAGFALLRAVESDPIAVATYAANLHKGASPERQKLLSEPRDLRR